jgi:hypothetical protein
MIKFAIGRLLKKRTLFKFKKFYTTNLSFIIIII